MQHNRLEKKDILKFIRSLHDLENHNEMPFNKKDYIFNISVDGGFNESFNNLEQIYNFYNEYQDYTFDGFQFHILFGHSKALDKSNGKAQLEAAQMIYHDGLGFTFDLDTTLHEPYHKTTKTETTIYTENEFKNLALETLKMLKKEADVVAKKYLKKRPKP
tara:strand:- start:13209 stop:13691 length:483 start_codon:yes stop_codon:yes gene_type:complete